VSEYGTKPRNLRAVATVLFSLLLLFQFGNEWAIAGWLPILLVRRLGTDPAAAIFSLALYFLFVALGRIVAQTVLRIVSHRRLLLASIVVAMAGYGLLALTHTFSAAFTAIVLIGLGFGPIFPLLGENLDDRLVLQPGLYNGIFSFAITGAMAAPWLLGYVLEYLGNEYLVLIPAFGSVAVFVLALLLMLEARLMRGAPPTGQGELLY
jgi:fucose permease